MAGLKESQEAEEISAKHNRHESRPTLPLPDTATDPGLNWLDPYGYGYVPSESENIDTESPSYDMNYDSPLAGSPSSSGRTSPVELGDESPSDRQSSGEFSSPSEPSEIATHESFFTLNEDAHPPETSWVDYQAPSLLPSMTPHNTGYGSGDAADATYTNFPLDFCTTKSPQNNVSNYRPLFETVCDLKSNASSSAGQSSRAGDAVSTRAGWIRSELTSFGVKRNAEEQLVRTGGKALQNDMDEHPTAVSSRLTRRRLSDGARKV
jgi:hypothetical protein